MASIEELEMLVTTMRIKEENTNNKIIFEKIKKCNTLVEKCVLIRYYLKPQSSLIETIIRNDLEISPPNDNTSGDGIKKGIRYEIKFSGHSAKSNVNFVQIRPLHKVDYYILAVYLMHSDASSIGEAHIFKVPSADIKELIVAYGGYAHGTIAKQGKISLESMNNNQYEYALRCNPFAKRGKGKRLWDTLMTYSVEYSAENF